MLYNLHTHSQFCDGKEDMERFVEVAIEHKFKTLGFSGHSPVPFDTYFSIKQNNLKKYSKEIDRLKSLYGDRICILKSLEIDFIPGITKTFEHFNEQIKMDYVIGSIHLVKGRDNRLWFIEGADSVEYDKGIVELFDSPEHAVKSYYNQMNEMITTESPDIVAHIDKVVMFNKGRFFNVEDKFYRNAFMETLELVKQGGLFLEINTRGIYKGKSDDLFPSATWLKTIKELQIPVLISSDAHHSGELLRYVPETAHILKNVGFKELISFDNNQWTEVGIDAYIEALKSVNHKVAN